MKVAAPGKLFLIGEYAVLEGAPSVLVPVEQQAIVELAPDNPGNVTSHSTQSVTLPVTDALAMFPLLEAITGELDCLAKLAANHLTIDTRAFHHDGKKLGLGSSAALAAALVSALLPDADTATRLAHADRAHRDFQGGRGSGADVALSMYGTPIVFQQGHAPRTVSLPAQLHMLAIWTGTPAATTDYVSRVQHWQAADPARFAAQLDQLVTIAENFLRAVESGSADQVLATIDQYNRQLASLSLESGANFYSEAHVALQKKVESARCIYKPSGAGGGDFGIAFSADREALNSLAHAMDREHRYTFFLE